MSRKWISPWGHLNILAMNNEDGDFLHESAPLQQYFIKAAVQFCDVLDLDHDEFSYPLSDFDLDCIADTR
jgi:hypothetical protein